MGLALVLAIASVSAIYLRSDQDETWNISDLSEEQKDLVEYIKKNELKIPQKSASDQFGWSDARTSRVTSELVDLGVVEKEREDRTNYLVLDEEELDGD